MKRKFPVRAALSIGCAVLGTVLAACIAVYLDGRMQEHECALLLEQVRQAAIGCYASEGRYPQSVDYLVEHYGLIYDEERYSILYDAFASNIMPDIDVNVRGGDER